MPNNRKQEKTNKWPVVFCALGTLVSFLPGNAFTDPSTVMAFEYWIFNTPLTGNVYSHPKIVLVQSGSLPDHLGFRQGDEILSPEDIQGVRKAFDRVKKGQKEMFIVKRGEIQETIEVSPLNWKWGAFRFSDWWPQAAGILFVLSGFILSFPRVMVPLPHWKPEWIGFVGLGIAAGFFLVCLGIPYLQVLHYYEGVPSGFLGHWDFYQAPLGTIAGLVLAARAFFGFRKQLRVQPIGQTVSPTG